MSNQYYYYFDFPKVRVGRARNKTLSCLRLILIINTRVLLGSRPNVGFNLSV